MLAPLDRVQIDTIEAAIAIEMMHKLRRSMMLWGPPGIGKSALFWQVAKRLGIRVIDIRAMTRNPVDVNGLPFVLFYNGDKPPSREPTEFDSAGYTVWSRPADLIPTEGEGIIIIEEINAATPAVQASFYQYVLDRCIGPHKLGAGWSIMCTGNRASDKGVVYQMPSPLSDRLQHYDLGVKLEPWMKWAFQRDINPLITGYLRMRDRYDIDDTDVTGVLRTADNPSPFAAVAPVDTAYGRAAPVMPNRIVIPENCGMLLRFDPTQRSFPTPRSWEFVSDEMTEIENSKLVGTNLEYATYVGKIGHVAATEVTAFARAFRAGFSLPAILTDPDHQPVPETPAMRCAVASALARNVDRNTFGNAIRYGERALTEEHLVSMVKDATGRDADLTVGVPEYLAFAKKYQDIMS